MLQRFAPLTSPAASTVLLPALVLALAACDGVRPPVAPSSASTDAPLLAKAQTRPTGKGIGVKSSKGDRTHQKLEYHDGPVMTGTPTVYFIWYGGWGTSPTPPILTDFITSLGGSSYFAINTLYRDASGGAPGGGVAFGGSFYDVYSMGANLTDSDVASIASVGIASGTIPLDPNGIYVVLPTPDVDVTSGFGTTYCGYHSTTNANGVTVPFILVGNPDRAPTKCMPQAIGPNGVASADAMASVLANELSNTVTDPGFTAWYDRSALEQADKCAWTYGTTYTTTNGARANVHLGTRDYLLQQLWVPGRRGVCALSVSAAAP
jgi:hypothetical protein